MTRPIASSGLVEVPDMGAYITTNSLWRLISGTIDHNCARNLEPQYCYLGTYNRYLNNNLVVLDSSYIVYSNSTRNLGP